MGGRAGGGEVRHDALALPVQRILRLGDGRGQDLAARGKVVQQTGIRAQHSHWHWGILVLLKCARQPSTQPSIGMAEQPLHLHLHLWRRLA